MLREGAISAEDTGFAFVTDSPAQAVEMIVSSQPPTVIERLSRAGDVGRNRMSKPIERISITTGGGDAPGLNAVIYAVVHAAARVGWQVFGVREGYNGLLYPDQYPDGGLIELNVEKVKNIAHLGGTILGTTNRGNPVSGSRAVGGRKHAGSGSVGPGDGGVPQAQDRRARRGRRRRKPDHRSATPQEGLASRRRSQDDR